MRDFFAKHWPAVLLALVPNIPAFWKGFVWLLDWAARIEFLAAHASASREFSGMIGFVANPPPWTVFITAAIGVAIVL